MNLKMVYARAQGEKTVVGAAAAVVVVIIIVVVVSNLQLPWSIKGFINP